MAKLTPRQLAANRANAQKSTGPKTEAGKDRSRFNSLKHGLTATEVCLPGESRAEYDLRRQEYIDYFQPANLIECDILDDLIAARWRKQRAVKFESALVLESFAKRRVQVQETYNSISPDVEAALAFQALCDNSESMKLLDRYEARLLRNIQVAWQQLEEAQQNRPPSSESPTGLPSEPIPENEHSENDLPENSETPPPHPPTPEHQPLGNATTPLTVILRCPAARQPQSATQNEIETDHSHPCAVTPSSANPPKEKARAA